MREEKTYIAFDDHVFTDRFECARHEFTQRPALLQLIVAAFADHSPKWQKNWCGGDPEEQSGNGPCACMGCANHYFYRLGLRYEHWKIWIDELRVESGEPNEDDQVDVMIVEVGPDRINTMLTLRKILRVGSQDALNVMKTPGLPFITGIDYYQARSIIKTLSSVGTTAKMVITKKLENK